MSQSEKFKHSTPIQIRFFDMDAFGHVNNAKYLTYFEEARIKYLDDIISWHYGWSKEGIIMARAEVDFLLPATFKDKISILTRCSHIGNKSFTLEYKMVKNEAVKEIVFAYAKTVVVMYDYEKNSSIPIPDNWKTAIRKYEGNI
jgi:acyl-CoA thioester hydrolase